MKVAAAIAPNHRLDSHLAPLGLTDSAPAAGTFPRGGFGGQHGSWNCDASASYKVVFVSFCNGCPAGRPVDFGTGFRGDDGKLRGCPVGVMVDPRGALIVAYDLSNQISRIALTR